MESEKKKKQFIDTTDWWVSEPGVGVGKRGEQSQRAKIYKLALRKLRRR